GLQIALAVEARFLNEPVVFGIMRHGEEGLAVVGFADPVEVGVEKSVGPGQQASRLRRSVPTELDGQRYRRGDCDDRERNGEGASDSHEMRSGNDSTEGRGGLTSYQGMALAVPVPVVINEPLRHG